MKIARGLLLWAALAAALFASGRYALHVYADGIRESVAREVGNAAQKHELVRYSVVVDSMKQDTKAYVDSVLGAADRALASAEHLSTAIRAVSRVHVVRDSLLSEVVRLTPEAKDSLVAVYVESDSAAYPAHPRLAEILVAQDSVLNLVAIPAFAQMRSTILSQNVAIYRLRAVIDSGSGLNLAQQVRITTLEQRLLRVQPRKLNKAVGYLRDVAIAYGFFRLGQAMR